ncbi:type I restriction enzyme, S subunit [Nitrosomonas ureae]|uniref:Type I restriction enzyme, S subunit n=1 Tax=Nitrosomonas ureae TaxID=44577 RepID=A0A285C0J0_9PROT|nr:restriction endonuclease subunit S [Nitrosomonas ureae]SNX60618.1 type I restriction enzyme, S subunit [Nitrosomonas ureae]
MTWRKVFLGDLFKVGSSKRVLKSQWTNEGIPFYRGREITRLATDGFVDNELFITEDHYAELAEKYGVPNAGDIVITAIGTIGNSHVVREYDKFYFKDASVLWLKRASNVSSEFINIWLKSPLFIDQLDRGNGATVDTLTIQKLQSVQLNLPPLPEQQRIVAILDEAFSAIAKAKANAEQNLKNTQELFESYLQSIFENKGVGWKEEKLREVIEYDKSQKVHNGLPYVGLEHIESNSGRFLGNLEPQAVKSSTFYFSNKHVLYGRLRPYLNKVLIPNFEGHCSTEIFPIKVSDKILREFLFYWLITRNTVKNIDATWTGARMPRANMNQVLTFDFAFPSKVEQQNIIEKLDILSSETKKLETIYQQKINDLEELKKSILQKAFGGELKTDKDIAA